MRLVGALDAILTVIAFGRKQLCDLVNSACRATTIDPRVEHALADLEPVIAQANIRREDKDLRPAVETDQKRRYFWVHAEFYHGQRPERDCFECGLDAHQRFAWFRRKQELHFVHHRHANSNFAVIHFFWDRILGTYRRPDAAQTQANGTLRTGGLGRFSPFETDLPSVFYLCVLTSLCV